MKRLLITVFAKVFLCSLSAHVGFLQMACVLSYLLTQNGWVSPNERWKEASKENG